MKYFILIVCCMVFNIPLRAQTALVDTVITENWQNNAWQFSSRTINSYNGACQLATVLLQQRNGSSWVNDQTTTYSYNSAGLIREELVQQWSANTWVNYSRTTNTYDVNGHLILQLEERSSGGTTWLTTYQKTYTYNTDGTVYQVLGQSVSNGIWKNDLKISYTYNADKTVQQEFREEGDLQGDYLSYTASYTYDARGRELTKYEEWYFDNYWYIKDPPDFYYSLTSNAYNNSSQLTITSIEEWDDWGYRSTSEIQFTYFNNGRLYQSVQQNTLADNYTVFENFLRNTYYYSSSCTLPLTLLDFSATLSGKDILLQWTTSKETYSSSFEIERSRNGNSFEKMGSVHASNNSTQKINYQFVDANPASLSNGKLYYRLKMVDRDGAYTYSKIAVVALPKADQLFSIYPTVAHYNLVVRLNAAVSTAAELYVIDQAGRQLYKQQANTWQPGSSLNINISSLPAGVYYLTLVTNEGTSTAKFIKQ